MIIPPLWKSGGILVYICPSFRPSVCPSLCPSFRNSVTFSSKISPQPCKLEESYLVYRLMMTCCIVGLQTSLLLLILPCICPIFFLSILWMMKFFVKDFCETLQARVVIFGEQVDNDVLYRGIVNQPTPAYSFLYLSTFLSFHTLNDEIFHQRFLWNCAS